MLVRQGLGGLILLIGSGGTIFTYLSRGLRGSDYGETSNISPLTITMEKGYEEEEEIPDSNIEEEQEEEVVIEPKPIVAELKSQKESEEVTTKSPPITRSRRNNPSGDIFRISSIPTTSLPVCGDPIGFAKQGDSSHIPNPDFSAKNDKGKDYRTGARCIYLFINDNVPRHKKVLVVFG